MKKSYKWLLLFLLFVMVTVLGLLFLPWTFEVKKNFHNPVTLNGSVVTQYGWSRLSDKTFFTGKKIDGVRTAGDWHRGRCFVVVRTAKGSLKVYYGWWLERRVTYGKPGLKLTLK